MIRYLAVVLLGLSQLGLPGTSESEPAQDPPAWVGMPMAEVIHAFGPPRKIRRDGRGAAVLVYRLRILGNEIVGAAGTSWSDLGIGPSPLPGSGDGPRGADDIAMESAGAVLSGGGLEIVATQKLRFHVNEEGLVFRQDISPIKWRKRAK